MPVSRKAVKRAVEESVTSQLELGETVVSAFLAVTGPSPWLMAQLGFINQLFIRRWYLSLTERRVITVSLRRKDIVSLGGPENRGEETIPPAQRAGIKITEVKRRPVWSSFRYGSPGTARPIRMNVHRIWRDDMDKFIGELASQHRGTGTPGAGETRPY
jgi:hypothetical protein